MKESPCLIRQHQVRSIPGGWKLTHPEMPGMTFTGQSPEHAIASLESSLRWNNKTIPRTELWEWANRQWYHVIKGAGQGDRWMGPPEGPEELPSDTAAKPAPRLFARTVLTPKETGPALWGALHLIPLVFTEERWMAHLRLMTALIAPKGNYEAGCVRCHQHWQHFLKENPPEAVKNPADAADWSLRAHNGASQNAGNRQWTWEEAARKWGWLPQWAPG